MGLDIELCKVLTKGEVTKLKKKYNVTDLIHPEIECDELDKISFIEVKYLINCITNIETFFNLKHCLNEQVMNYYNVQAMLLKSKILFKSKDPDLSNYYITGVLPSDKGDNYTKYEISNMKNTKDDIYIHMSDDEVNKLNYKVKEYGFFIKDIEYIQRNGIKINKNLTGKCYNDDVYRLFISSEDQLKKLNENNEYEDCELKRNFKIPKNHLLYINW